MKEWKGSRKKKCLRMLATALVYCLLFTYPDTLESLSVFAAETQVEDHTVYVSGFAELSENVREQTVPVGTDIEELILPSILDAFVPITEDEALTENVEETADKTELPKTEGENSAVDNGDSQSEESSVTELENADNGESAPSVQAENPELTQETSAVTPQENQSENTVTVKILESTQEAAAKEDFIAIEGVAWQSEPEYDGNTEGTYIFTALLPVGYALMEDVSLPRITVRVQAESTDSVIQEILDKIAALTDSEEYLAAEPNISEEESHAKWTDGLHSYAEEVLGI